MDTVSPPVLVKLIKNIFSTILTTINPKPQPIEIKHDWPYASNGEILPYVHCFPVQEHCIGLCQSPSYHSGRENRLYLSLDHLPLDWKSIRQIILKTILRPKTPVFLEESIQLFDEQRRVVKNGVGRQFIDMFIMDGHIMMRIATVLPIDENFVVHGYSREKPSSQQSRCWHGSVELERDCDELIQRIRKPVIYSKVDCPDGYFDTGLRRCQYCPSEYLAWVLPAGVSGGHGKKYPYRLYLARWVDLGEYKKEEESQEFRALTAGQVCCDYLTRAEEPPIDCLWQGRDWSTIPLMRDRVKRQEDEMEKRRAELRRWYQFW